jgi:choline dehydrogenase-like flavoprotein
LHQRSTLRVLLHANAIGFACSPNGERVDSVEIAAIGGARMRIKADHFVLCCGGMENARLLLASAETAPALMHGKMHAVGRYLMQHPRGRIATIEADPAHARRLQDTFNVMSRRGGVQFELGFALPADVQRRERLLNCSAVLTYDADPESSWERIKRALRGQSRNSVADAAAALTGLDQIAANAWRRTALGRQPLLETQRINVIIDLEQAPDPESRLTLGEERDALGMRRLKADWRIGRLERETAARFAELLAGEFSRLGLGAVRLEPWAGEGAMPAEELVGTYHHIATTRMSQSPRDGVVDANCKVHGVANLFVQGCSVFPTGGHANPTLSIVALALRQAEILLTL